MNDKKSYIAIDIGGTYAKIAEFKSFTKPVFKKESFEMKHRFEDDFKHICKIVNNFTKDKIVAIGMGVPGRLNTGRNKLVAGRYVKEWLGKDIKNKFSIKFNCKVYLENDAVASALGEAYYGKKEKGDFIFIIWGTGVGGAVVKVKSKPKAQKIQRKYLNEFEAVCGGRNLFEKYGKLPSKLGKKNWANVASDMEQEIINLSNALKIKNIVIGGGVAIRNKARIAPISKKLHKNNNIKLRVTGLGDSNTFCLYGSAALILQKHLSK